MRIIGVVMKYYKNILITGCLLFGVVVSSYGQQENVSELIQKAEKAGIELSAVTELRQRAEERGMTGEQLTRILQTAIEMQEQNLPADFAVQKALEGLSKGIPGNRIVPVIDRIRTSTGEAVRIIDPWLQNPDVQNMIQQSDGAMSPGTFRSELAKSASKSLMQNIPSQTIGEVLSEIGTESLLQRTGPSDIVAALGILPDLPTTENEPHTSASFLVRALKGGFKANELQKLPSALKIAQQRSELPAASVVEGVANQMQGGIPAKQILQNLFDGRPGGGPPGNAPKGLENRQNRGNNNG